MKHLNILLVLCAVMIAALIKSPSLALGIPLCFLIAATVIVFYFDLDDYRKLVAVKKEIEELRQDIKLLKSSMNYKNL